MALAVVRSVESARSSRSRIDAEEFLRAFDDQRYHRRGGDEAQERLVESLAAMFPVVLFGELLTHPQHFQSGNPQSTLFDARDQRSNQPPLHGVRLQDDECAFQDGVLLGK